MQACFHLGMMEMNLVRVWCLMQTHIVKQAPSLSAGYIDPNLIAASNFEYPKLWKMDCEELATGKTVEDKEAIRKNKIYKAGFKVAARIARCLKDLQHNEMIWLPYHFGNHWILVGVEVGLSMAVVFDSADYALETYMDFIAILRTAFRHYVDYHNGRHHPKRKGDLGIKTLCPCLKQRPGSLHCGYYICCMMSNTSAYRRHPNLWKEEKNKKRDVYKDDELLELVSDLCGFIIDEVVSSRGAYHDRDSDLGSNPRYQHLRETHRLSLGH